MLLDFRNMKERAYVEDDTHTYTFLYIYIFFFIIAL